jgi:hypothetical protein
MWILIHILASQLNMLSHFSKQRQSTYRQIGYRTQQILHTFLLTCTTSWHKSIMWSMNVGDCVLNYAQSFGFRKLPFTILTPSLLQCKNAELLKLKSIDKAIFTEPD